MVLPKFSGYYDPYEVETDGPRKVNVYYKEEITEFGNERPWLLIMEGGGWSPSSGFIGDDLNTSLTSNFDIKLYNRGFAIIKAGYSVRPDLSTPIDDPTFPLGGHAFDAVTGLVAEDSITYNLSGGGWRLIDPGGSAVAAITGWDQALDVAVQEPSDLLLLNPDPSALAIRCAEKDTINVIQYLRFNAATIGISNVPSKFGYFGKSAGSFNLGFCAFARQRHPLGQAPGTRFSFPVRPGFFISRSTVLNLRLYDDDPWGDEIAWHMTNGSGAPALTFSEALNNLPGGLEEGEKNFQRCAAHYFSQNYPSARVGNANLPVYLISGDQYTATGTLEFSELKYTSMKNVGIVSAHPPEQVKAMENIMYAIDASPQGSPFLNTFHQIHSKFRYLAYESITEAALNEDIYQWVLSRTNISDFAPPIEFEPGTGFPPLELPGPNNNYLIKQDCEDYSFDVPNMLYSDRELKNEIIRATEKNQEKKIHNIYKEALRQVLFVFNNIKIIDGENKIQKVRIFHGNPERSVAEILKENNIVLPVITVTQNVSNEDLGRRRNSSLVVNSVVYDKKDLKAKRVYSVAPIPVNILFNLNVWAKYKEDIDQICQQIRMYFNPVVPIKTAYGNNNTLFLTSESDDSLLDLSDKEDRIIRRQFELELQTYIPNPKILVTNTGAIEYINIEDLEDKFLC